MFYFEYVLIFFLDYTRDLENEIQQLKTINRELRNKFEDLAKETEPPHGRSTPTLSDPGVKSHVKELNDTIGEHIFWFILYFWTILDV